MRIDMRLQRLTLLTLASAVLTVGLHAQRAAAKGGPNSIEASSLKEWLTYIASDELQGREVYTEGLGLAASYIADHLKQWGLKPAGEDGSYFQTVKVLGVTNASRSSITVDVNGERRSFKDGEAITLPRNVGSKRVVTAEDIRFVGYGAQLPSKDTDDYKDIDPSNKVIVWLGSQGPRDAGDEGFRSFATRTRYPIEKGAAAVIFPPYAGGRGRGSQSSTSTGPPPSSTTRDESTAAPPAGRRGRGAQVTPDFTVAGRLDAPMPPSVTAQDEFFEFLFSSAEVKYSELKELASRREPLPRFALKGVKLTLNIEPEYSIVSTRLTRNIVGLVEGTDPTLKDTYVTFGSHYDHIGYQSSGRGGGFGNFGCPGQTRPEPRSDDIINNGADDDGSGTVALMSIARAFALGPRPKRSLVFVWHTAEESGLLGSRYNADYPIVPNDKIVAQLNVDMVGRNRCDQSSEANTVYLVGSDRISTELHNLSEDVNASTANALTIDYELNDPTDPQSLYTRSDHYSYAAKGIPIIFYTTGLHRDYHYLTDEVDKILWDKLTRITQLVYATGQRLANLEHAPARDNKGPRMGKGSRGKIK
jgi:hypothetical protein